jgi:hypothetical protein
MAKEMPYAGIHVSMARTTIDLALTSNMAMLADGSITILALLPGCSATKRTMANEKFHGCDSFQNLFKELRAVLFQDNRQEKLHFWFYYV